MLKAYHLFWVLLITLLLSACSEKDDGDTVSETQKYYFLESLKLVEQAGRELQSSGLTQTKITQALETMDQGLKLAFQVENDFLNALDARLGKNYQRYFVKGVETYRLGIEAGVQSDQQAGLKLLSQWAGFWSANEAEINAKLHPG
jgi:hypothetical protein